MLAGKRYPLMMQRWEACCMKAAGPATDKTHAPAPTTARTGTTLCTECTEPLDYIGVLLVKQGCCGTCSFASRMLDAAVFAQHVRPLSVRTPPHPTPYLHSAGGLSCVTSRPFRAVQGAASWSDCWKADDSASNTCAVCICWPTTPACVVVLVTPVSNCRVDPAKCHALAGP
jgi:hypothetical protein